MKKNLQIISSAIVMTLFSLSLHLPVNGYRMQEDRLSVTAYPTGAGRKTTVRMYRTAISGWTETRTGFMKTTILTPAAGCLPPHRMAMAKLLIPTALS